MIFFEESVGGADTLTHSGAVASFANPDSGSITGPHLDVLM